MLGDCKVRWVDYRLVVQIRSGFASILKSKALIELLGSLVSACGVQMQLTVFSGLQIRNQQLQGPGTPSLPTQFFV